MVELPVLIRPRVQRQVILHLKRQVSEHAQLKIKVGQELEPQDQLGEEILNTGFVSINLATALQANPSQVSKYLTRPIGSRFFQGELIAQKKGVLGLGNKLLLSPKDCVLEEVNSQNGEARLKFLPQKKPIIAGMYGIVDGVSAKGFTIRTQATQVFGLFGSGKQRFGELKILNARAGLATKLQITPQTSRQILVVGALIFGDALRQAISQKVDGVITGGLNAKDAKAICGSLDLVQQIPTDIGLSLMVTEGFGPVPIGEDIFEVLKQAEGQYVFLDGNACSLVLPLQSADSIMKIRKVILPVAQEQTKPAAQEQMLTVGALVRMIWPPFMGAQGRVVAIDDTATTLPSGISTFLVTVELNTRKLKVPYRNVEIIA